MVSGLWRAIRPRCEGWRAHRLQVSNAAAPSRHERNEPRPSAPRPPPDDSPRAQAAGRVGRQHTGRQIPYAVLHAYIRACGHGESPLLPRGISRGYGKGFEVQCDPRVAAGCQPAGSLICLLSLGSDSDLFRRSDTRGNHHFTNGGLGLGLRSKTSGPSVSHCDG